MGQPQQRIDMAGKVFGRLKVVTYSRTDRRGQALWLCRCSCGVRRVVSGGELRSGRTKSCRKCSREQMSERARALNEGRAPVLPGPRMGRPEDVLRTLSPERRALYERWERACERIGHKAPSDERMQVLREILT